MLKSFDMAHHAKALGVPARQVCQLCALDDEELVSWEVEGPGLWRYRCTNHTPPWTWLTDGAAKIDESAMGGIAYELGVYDALLGIFIDPGQFLEWGVVEHHFASANPQVYEDLVNRYSHMALGATRYSASAFLGQAAGKLSREGSLAIRTVPATGYWSYNSAISAFCLAPASESATPTTWEAFAVAQGFDPDDWPALGFENGKPAARGRLVRQEVWEPKFATTYFNPDQLSAQGLCAWEHNRINTAPAAYLIVTENNAGIQDARAVCEQCIPGVLKYVSRKK